MTSVFADDEICLVLFVKIGFRNPYIPAKYDHYYRDVSV